MEKRSERSGRFLFLGERKRFNTEVAEEEHRGHREDNPRAQRGIAVPPESRETESSKKYTGSMT
jgi:hypothetical protein